MWVFGDDSHCEMQLPLSFPNQDHPGGANSIMAYAGKEASKAFDMLHSADILDKVEGENKLSLSLNTFPSRSTPRR